MQTDARRYVRKCDKCQRHSKMIHSPAEELHPISSPWPFAMWGMDIVGPLPKATGGREYLLAATDYFTKWIEAVPLAKIREQEVVKFMWEHLICRFGIPYAVITDNGKQFKGRKVSAFCKEHGILQQASTPRYPHHRGTGKPRHQTILDNLKSSKAHRKLFF